MDLFAKAQKIAAKPTAKAKAEKMEIAIAGIEQLAELKAMIDSLTAAAKTIETEVKEAGLGEFLKMDTQVRPESFKGIDGQATCSVEMRKRSTNSALNADEVAELDALGLKPFKQIVTTQMYGINPVHAANMELMTKVSEALQHIVPEGFVVLQEEASKMVVDDALLNEAFKLKGADRENAVRLVTTMALKPKLNADYDMKQLAAKVNKYLMPEEVPAATPEVVVALEAAAVEMIAEKPAKKTRAKKVAA